MIRFLTRKNDTDLTRLVEKATLAGTDRIPVETTGSGDLRRWISFTNLATAVTTSIINTVVPTGVMVPWLTTVAPTGWLLASGRTIGSAASGGTERANADTSALYSLIWQAFANTELAIQDSTGVTTTRGVSATADYAANKRLPLPDLRDRGVIGLANMGGTDAALISVFDTTIIGKTGGVDEVTLTAGQLPAHTHTTAVPGTTAASAAIGVDVATPTATAPVESSSIGSGAPVSIIQPSIILPFIIKL